MRRSATAWSLLAGLLLAGELPVAVGALYQDIERDDASAVRRALESGQITLDAKVGEPPIPMLAAAARAGSVQVVRLRPG